MRCYKLNGLLTRNGWISPAFVVVDATGCVRSISAQPPVEEDAQDPSNNVRDRVNSDDEPLQHSTTKINQQEKGSIEIETINGFALPGFRNSHSHAFQYAMAGMAERHAPGTTDDFWSWREAMYTCALRMRPDSMENIAAMLYAEMLRHGYTHVAEFHYLHHDENGAPYANLAEMGERLVAAAATAGIKITLVPVWYQKGDFGKPPTSGQRRFICHSRDEYFKLLEASRRVVDSQSFARLGFGVHSLRAVEAPEVIATYNDGPGDIPFHLHVAEQLKEVGTSLGFLGMRPAEWLLRHLPVNERFHLVHCTHLTDEEIAMLAHSDAHVVLCPGTEGNLGDGIFRLSEFADARGKWSIGTDSQISLNPLEDLRWLDYGQRLSSHRRNTFDDGGKRLIDMTWNAGNSALGISAQEDYFIEGEPFDAVVYDAASPLLSRGLSDDLLPSILYTADASCILGTLVNGRWVVREGRHQQREEITKRYQRAIASIYS